MLACCSARAACKAGPPYWQLDPAGAGLPMAPAGFVSDIWGGQGCPWPSAVEEWLESSWRKPSGC